MKHLYNRRPAWLLSLLIIGLFTISALAEDNLANAIENIFSPRVSGFVDAAYFNDGNANPDAGEFNGFSLDQVEVDIESGLGDRGFLRADIEYVNGVDPVNAIDLLEQGYLQYNVPINDKQLSLTFGKFNAPIGFELLDPVDMYQYSHSEVFAYGLPTNLTGGMGFMQFSPTLALHAYIVNGWDNNTENNDAPTVGGRLGITPVEKINVGLSAITGPEQPGKDAKSRTVFDIDATVEAIDNLILGGEFNMGSEAEAADINGKLEDAGWTGFTAMGHYTFNNWFGLTARLGSFSDDFGIRTGNANPKDISLTSITISPTFTLGERMGCLLELRMDSANEEIWTDSDGNATDSRTTAAFEVTYSF
ncbi:MAG: outer membrane beta-barrel protein [Calditrichota bacterium]